MLDLHFHFRHAGQHQQRDGVHWDERAHCHLSQLLLAHLADAWGVDLPCRYPVGRWIRDGPTRGLPGPVDSRQPRDSRGDPGEQPLSWFPATSACLRGDLRNPFPRCDLCSSPTAKAPVCPTTHFHSAGNSPVILQRARSDTHWRSKLNGWPGDTCGPDSQNLYPTSEQKVASLPSPVPQRAMQTPAKAHQQTDPSTPRGKTPVARPGPGLLPNVVNRLERLPDFSHSSVAFSNPAMVRTPSPSYFHRSATSHILCQSLHPTSHTILQLTFVQK